MSPHIVNAYFGSTLNEIVFPAGILQPPYFDPKADDAVNFGGIGMVIGHEIMHGFDDRGRRYDADGNLREWWTPADRKRYQERAQAIVAQYDAYAGVDGLKVNGKLTLGENIADLGGIQIAYLGLQRALAGQPRAEVDGFTPGAALLPRLRAGLALALPARAGAPAPAHRQPLAAALPRAGAARQPAGVREGLLLPGRRQGTARRGRAGEPVVSRPPA